MSDYLDALKRDDQIASVRKSLEEWLKHKDWKLEELLDWLQGYELPLVGYDYEAYVWVVRALLTSNARDALEKELSLRLARLLETQPDVNRPGDRPDEALYNLFMLCAELKRKEVLSQPLNQVYERRRLDGKWHGLGLRPALRAALIYNQTSKKLKKVWRAMVGGQKDSFLGGRERDGFEGLLHMPKNVDSDEPDVDEIGYALKAMANYLAEDRARRSEFQSLIKQVKRAFPSSTTWDVDLIYQADKHEWERWAVDSLDNLYIPLEGSSVRLKKAILWRPVADCIPRSKCQISKELCKGRMLEVKLGREADLLAQTVARDFAGVISNNPYSSDRSIVGAVATAMVEIEQKLRMEKKNEIEVAVRQARVSLLKDAAVPVCEIIYDAAEYLVNLNVPIPDKVTTLRSIINSARVDPGFLKQDQVKIHYSRQSRNLIARALA